MQHAARGAGGASWLKYPSGGGAPAFRTAPPSGGSAGGLAHHPSHHHQQQQQQQQQPRGRSRSSSRSRPPPNAAAAAAAAAASSRGRTPLAARGRSASSRDLSATSSAAQQQTRGAGGGGGGPRGRSRSASASGRGGSAAAPRGRQPAAASAASGPPRVRSRSAPGRPPLSSAQQQPPPSHRTGSRARSGSGSRRPSLSSGSGGDGANGGGGSGSGSGIVVYARLRPAFADEEVDGDPMRALSFLPDRHSVYVRNQFVEERDLEFTQTFGQASTQESVFETVGCPVVASALRGQNGTFIAYGQTGTGKTYTAFHKEEERGGAGGGGLVLDPSRAGGCGGGGGGGSPPLTLHPNDGLMFRCVKDLFARVEEDRRAGRYHTSVQMQLLQLYTEQIQDLLAEQADASASGVNDTRDSVCGSSNPLNLTVTGNSVIQGLSGVEVKTPSDVMLYYDRGMQNRTVRLTSMNAQSSRSHAVFVLRLTRTPCDASNPATPPLSGKLTIVDLAGSERIKRTQADGLQRLEAQAINKSLSCLGNVINALAENSSASSAPSGVERHVPYRDSKLTRILQDSLGEQGHACILITVSPALNDVTESMSSLAFGQRALMVRHRARAAPEARADRLHPEMHAAAVYASAEYRKLCEEAAELRREKAALKEEAEKWEGRCRLKCMEVRRLGSASPERAAAAAAAAAATVAAAGEEEDLRRQLAEDDVIIAEMEEHIKKCRERIRGLEEAASAASAATAEAEATAAAAAAGSSSSSSRGGNAAATEGLRQEVERLTAVVAELDSRAQEDTAVRMSLTSQLISARSDSEAHKNEVADLSAQLATLRQQGGSGAAAAAAAAQASAPMAVAPPPSSAAPLARKPTPNPPLIAVLQDDAATMPPPPGAAGAAPAAPAGAEQAAAAATYPEGGVFSPVAGQPDAGCFAGMGVANHLRRPLQPVVNQLS